MRTGNYIRSAVPLHDSQIPAPEKRGWHVLLGGRKLRAAVMAATLLLPAACGGKHEAKPHEGQEVIPVGSVVRLDGIDNHPCKDVSPESGVTSELVDALMFTFAGALRPTPHAVERTRGLSNSRRPAAAATKPTAPPTNPKPTTTNAPAPSPSATTTSAPRPTATTVRPNPSPTQATEVPQPLPVTPSSATQSPTKREQATSGMLPPVSATAPAPAIPLASVPQNLESTAKCGDAWAYVEVSSTGQPPANYSTNIVDAGNKAYVVTYDDFIAGSGLRTPQDVYALKADVPIASYVL